ncbi:acyltransferase family protein [Brevibacterium oceani]|uniref:acyltransferase family protein n=1 Tax=Brevibacterium oceani TaxID=358099 RepID=UPI0015E6938F|nr:acyltransferase [Brevibacterium oceani]
MSLTLTEPPAPRERPVHEAGPATTPSAGPGSRIGESAAVSGLDPARPRRDPAIDLVRFACLIVVIVLHSMMSAAVLGPDGTVVPTVALSDTSGFAVASWFFQVMPLFFVIGGCAGIIAWRRTRARGGTWADYLRARVRRLVVPVTVLIALTGLGLSVASELGVAAGLLAEASRRIGQPLWFLAVYVGLTALVPLAVHFHERSPRRSLAVLAGAVIVVDGVVAATGVHGLGYLNFVLVWPLIQQLGFVYADALERPVRRLRTWVVLVTALLTVIGLVSAGVYSPNMLVNLNPPTGALVLLGAVQMCALRLVHARLNRMLTLNGGGGHDDDNAVSGGQSGTTIDEAAPGPRILRAQIWRWVIDWGNRFGMQVYLWHMSVVIVLIGGLGALAQTVSGIPAVWGLPGLVGFVLPDIGSGWWWASRLPWLLVVMGLSALVAMLAERIPFPSERGLAAAGRGIGRIICEMRGNAGTAGVGTPRDAGLTPHVRAVTPEVRTLTPQVRAAIAVAAATAGIAIALLVGIAPLIWTVLALALLMGSLVIAAGLGSRAARVPGATITPQRRPAGR